MNKSYNFDKPFDRKRFSRDIAKLAEKKAESIKKEMETSYVFLNKTTANFPYSPVTENPLYNLRRIRCPKCFKEIGVKIGTNHCTWCNYQINVDENYPFLM